MLMREGPGSLVGVGEARAVRGGPSWSLATTGESDVNFWTLSLTEPTRRNWDGPASEVGSRFGVGCRGLSTDSERWQDFVSDGSALLVLEKPLMESKVSEGSVGPGRGCKEKHHIGRGSQAKELTCLASPPLAQLTLLMTRPRELDGTGDMGGSGLGASEGCGSGSELTGASTAGHWAPAGSSRGSGEALVGELWGEAGELGLPPGGALSRSVTVVTSWLVSSGVGVGSSTSVCCSCCSGSGTLPGSNVCAACLLLSSRGPLLGSLLHSLPAKVAALIS